MSHPKVRTVYLGYFGSVVKERIPLHCLSLINVKAFISTGYRNCHIHSWTNLVILLSVIVISTYYIVYINCILFKYKQICRLILCILLFEA